MARQSAEHKAETHRRILDQASRSFRQRGSGVGIGDLMQELGLTHGGFYRHFESKEALFVDAVSLSFLETCERLKKVAEKAPKGKELESIVNAYLSVDHATGPESGCAVSALAQDVARQSVKTREQIEEALKRYMSTMAKYLPGATKREREGKFLVLFSGMAGALMTARSFGSPRLRSQLLGAAREFYIDAFAR